MIEDFLKWRPCCVLILNKDFVGNKNSINCTNFYKAHKEASDWIEEHKKTELINANNWGSGNVESLTLNFLETIILKFPMNKLKKL